MQNLTTHNRFALAATLFALAGLLSCGGHSAAPTAEREKPVPALSSGSLTQAEALAQLEALPTPAGVDSETFGMLKDAMRQMLEHADTTRWVSTPPTGLVNQIQDVTTGIDDLGQKGIQWNYRNTGDYDLNSEVNISDITPIGQHFGATSADPDWKESAQFVDGDRNGEVNIADITPIGANFLHKVSAYIVQGSAVPEGPWSDLDQTPFEAGRPLLAGIRMYHFLPAVQNEFYRVVPVDEVGTQGEPSLPSVDFLVNEKTRIIGDVNNPDSPQFLARGANDVMMTLPAGVPNPIEPGDIVVGEQDGGYLLRAQVVEQTGQQVHVTGEPGILTDVFLQGGLAQALDDISQVPPEVYTIDLADQVLCNVPGLSGVVNAGSVSFLPQADVAVNYNEYGGVTYLKGLVLGGPMQYSMNVTLSSDEWSGPFPPTPADLPNFEKKLNTFNFDFVAYQNGVPVTMALQYDIYLGIEGEGDYFGIYSAQGSSTYDNIRSGAIFTLDGGIEEINEFTSTHGVSPEPVVSTFGGDVRFSVYCRPEVHIKLYGNPVAGNSEDLALTLKPYMQLTGTQSADPLGVNYLIEATLDNTYNMSLHHMGLGTETHANDFADNLETLLSGFIPTIEPPG